MSAAEGQHSAKLAVDALKALKTDESFQQLWHEILHKIETCDVSEPVVPRHRKQPARYEERTAEPHFPLTPEDLYHPVYVF